jgi:hypothetical protein
MSAQADTGAGVQIRLAADQLAALAEMVAERLSAGAGAAAVSAAAGPADGAGLVSAGVLAVALGCSRAFVYEHADALGAVRLGDGSRARLRFDPEAARAALSRYSSERSQGPIPNAGAGSKPVPARRSARRPLHRPEPGSILPSRPRQAQPLDHGGAA